MAEPAARHHRPIGRSRSVSDYYTPFSRQRRVSRLRGPSIACLAARPVRAKQKRCSGKPFARRIDTPRVDTLLLRRTFPELEGSLLSYFRRDVPRELYRNYNEAKHIVTWRNGSTTRFGYSAGENDIYQYQGAEFLFIGVDELTHFTLGQWQFLTSRNRCAVPGTKPNMAGATNPGNIGHAWVKALWVDRRPAPGMDRPGQYDPNDYAFIRATLADNPLYKDDATIGRRWTRCHVTCGRHFWTATGTSSPANISISSTCGGTPRAPNRSVSSRGGRDGSPSIGASSIPARSIGTRRAQTGGRRGHVSRIRGQSSLAAHAGAGHRRAFRAMRDGRPSASARSSFRRMPLRGAPPN